MRNENISYWIERYQDKSIDIKTKDGPLIEMKDDIRIEMADVISILNDICPLGYIFNVINQTNSTSMDIIRMDSGTEVDEVGYLGGIRVNIRHGLVAPDISTIIMNESSCAIIDCAPYLDKLTIKGLTYDDILRVIRERLQNCFDSVPSLISSFASIADDSIPNAHHRISLYCREHGLPERVRSYALSTFDDTGLETATYGDIINLFGVLGYIDEIKESSSRKLQRLAGYIVIKTSGEQRCHNCDSVIIED
jgi:hypothetical protein